jgi:hypothetical protein
VCVIAADGEEIIMYILLKTTDEEVLNRKVRGQDIAGKGDREREGRQAGRQAGRQRGVKSNHPTSAFPLLPNLDLSTTLSDSSHLTDSRSFLIDHVMCWALFIRWRVPRPVCGLTTPAPSAPSTKI